MVVYIRSIEMHNSRGAKTRDDLMTSSGWNLNCCTISVCRCGWARNKDFRPAKCADFRSPWQRCARLSSRGKPTEVCRWPSTQVSRRPAAHAWDAFRCQSQMDHPLHFPNLHILFVWHWVKQKTDTVNYVRRNVNVCFNLVQRKKKKWKNALVCVNIWIVLNTCK